MPRWRMVTRLNFNYDWRILIWILFWSRRNIWADCSVIRIIKTIIEKHKYICWWLKKYNTQGMGYWLNVLWYTVRWLCFQIIVVRACHWGENVLGQGRFSLDVHTTLPSTDSHLRIQYPAPQSNKTNYGRERTALYYREFENILGFFAARERERKKRRKRNKSIYLIYMSIVIKPCCGRSSHKKTYCNDFVILRVLFVAVG